MSPIKLHQGHKRVTLTWWYCNNQTSKLNHLNQEIDEKNMKESSPILFGRFKEIDRKWQHYNSNIRRAIDNRLQVALPLLSKTFSTELSLAGRTTPCLVLHVEVRATRHDSLPPHEIQGKHTHHHHNAVIMPVSGRYDSLEWIKVTRIIRYFYKQESKNNYVYVY